MSNCWRCDAKSEYFDNKKQLAIEEAEKKARDEKITIAIWKEGPIYKTGSIAAAGHHSILEYISIDLKNTVLPV